MPYFELEPKASYFSTYSDNIITGSMLPNGLRGYVGSYVSGNLSYQSSTILSDFIDLKNTRNGVSFFRNVRFFSKETIYDSFIPDIFEIYKTNGGQFCYGIDDVSLFFFNNPRRFIKFVFGTYAMHVSGTDNNQVSDNKWLGSFPFMGIYSGFRRLVTDIFPVNTSSYDEKFFAPDPFVYEATPNVLNTAKISSSLYYVNIAGTTLQNVYSPIVAFEAPGSYAPSTDTFSFNIGDGNSLPLAIKQFKKIVFGSKVKFLEQTPGPGLPHSRSQGPVIRGWKYGLLSAFRTNTSIVFRHNHFGQYRDMLEQRIYTKSYNIENGTTSTNVAISFVTDTQAFLTASDQTLNTRDSAIYTTGYQTGQPWID